MNSAKNALIVPFAVLMLLLISTILVQGCTSTISSETSGEKRSEEANNSKTNSDKIKPTGEMARFYSAIKDADRVIIIKGSDNPDEDKGANRQEQVPLSVFYKDGPMFWDIMGAVVSAETSKEPQVDGDGARYIMRWYKKGYKELGEISIDTGSGSLVVNYPGAGVGESYENKTLHIAADHIKVIKKAVEADKKIEEKPNAPTI